MDAIDHEDRLADSPSRRTVIKTGVKLAYVAPVLAASFKLRNVSAQGAVTGNPNPECRGARCGTFTPCSTNNVDCVCTTTTSGGGFCVPGSTQCNTLVPCGRDGSCPAGSLCAVDTCCIDPVCIPVSLTCPPSDRDSKASESSSRESSGPGTVGG